MKSQTFCVGATIANGQHRTRTFVRLQKEIRGGSRVESRGSTKGQESSVESQGPENSRGPRVESRVRRASTLILSTQYSVLSTQYPVLSTSCLLPPAS